MLQCWIFVFSPRRQYQLRADFWWLPLNRIGGIRAHSCILAAPPREQAQLNSLSSKGLVSSQPGVRPFLCLNYFVTSQLLLT